MDVLKLLTELTKKYPKLEWPIIFSVCVIIVLLYKVLEHFIPKVISSLVVFSRRKYSAIKRQAAQESAIRDFTINMQPPNWLTCVRSISKYNINVPLIDFYEPLRFNFHDMEGKNLLLSIERILTENKTFSIIGPPGSGKSTILSILAIQFAKDTLEETYGIKESRLPLYYSLKNLPDELSPLHDILTSSFREAGCAIDDDLIENQLKNGRCVVLLDGLDETGEKLEKRNVVEWIRKSISAFPNNRFIISCRNTEWAILKIPNIPQANIMELSDEEIRRIIAKWEKHYKINEDSDTGNTSLYGIIKDPKYPHLFTIAKNPLLLTIMIIFHFNDIAIPSREAELYNTFLRILIGEWDEIKNLRYVNFKFQIEKKLKIVQRVALFLFENENHFEKLNLKSDDVEVFLRKELDGVFGETIQISDFIESLLGRTGLLQEIKPGVYSFTHRGFSEFLAAKELAESSKFDMICEHLYNQDWFEIIKHFVSLLPDSTSFLSFLSNQEMKEPSFYYRFILLTVRMSVSIENEIRNEVVEKANKYITEELLAGNDVNVPLFKEACLLNKKHWSEFLGSKLIDNEIDPEIICGLITGLEDINMLSLLTNAYDVVDEKAKGTILKSLSDCSMSESIDILWSVIEKADSLQSLAIGSMAAKGEIVIQSCKEVLKSSSSSEMHQKSAVTILCKTNDPLIVPYLVDCLYSIASLEIDFHIRRELEFIQYHNILSEKKTTNLYSNNFYLNYCKRPLDILLSSILIILYSPFLFAISIMIKLDSPGPVFFSQERIGRKGKRYKIYKIYKFRSMVKDAEELSGPVWASDNDPRITMFGRFLRRTRIDEIPQLVNIVKGDMSLVGPRPERQHFIEQLEQKIELYSQRLEIRPGLTGLAQINYSYGSTIEDFRSKLKYDLYYISRCSLFLDIKIILKTIIITCHNMFRNEKIIDKQA